jgi:endonuclease G
VLDGDYAGSGYDRGHLCPSASRTADEESNAATFYTTNILPQRHDLNAGAWEELEAWTHRMVRRGWDAFVIAGGIWPASCSTAQRATPPGPDCPSIGRSRDPARRVAVPLSTWKVVVLVPPGSGPEAVHLQSPVVAVDMPNDGSAGADWRRYITTVDTLEARTGYELLSNVSVAVQAWIEAQPYRGE